MNKILDTIVQVDDNPKNPLRGKASLVPFSDIDSVYVRDCIRAMKQALTQEDDGVAIAAPQIGIPLQIFVVSEKAYEEGAKFTPLVFINPSIIKRSKKKTVMQEGCLSVRWIYGKTNRHTHVTVEAYDEDGKKFTFGGSGLLAHIFQHEIDHLHGVLFIDHGFDLEEYTEEEVRESFKKGHAHS